MTLVGQPLLSGCLASLICTLIVSYSKGFVKRFFTFFWGVLCSSFSPCGYSVASLPSPLDTLIVSQLGWFVKREIEIFSTFFALLLSVPLLLNRALHSRHSLRSLLTMIVYHRPHTKSIGNVAQIRDFSWRLFCWFCLLTFSGGYDIMEIPRPATVGAAPKIKRKSGSLMLPPNPFYHLLEDFGPGPNRNLMTLPVEFHGFLLGENDFASAQAHIVYIHHSF